MDESDRPIDERVSLLGRPRDPARDVLPEGIEWHARRQTQRIETVRLAISTPYASVYIGEGDGESLMMMCEIEGGSGSAGTPRNVFAAVGAMAGSTSTPYRTVAYGVVPDSVLAVRFGPVDALCENNAFAAEGVRKPYPLTLTYLDGHERTIDRESAREALQSLHEELPAGRTRPTTVQLRGARRR